MAQEKENQSYNLYFILGLVFGALTALAISDSVFWSVIGGLIGLLFASFYVNALVKDRSY